MNECYWCFDVKECFCCDICEKYFCINCCNLELTDKLNNFKCFFCNITNSYDQNCEQGVDDAKLESRLKVLNAVVSSDNFSESITEMFTSAHNRKLNQWPDVFDDLRNKTFRFLSDLRKMEDAMARKREVEDAAERRLSDAAGLLVRQYALGVAKAARESPENNQNKCMIQTQGRQTRLSSKREPLTEPHSAVRTRNSRKATQHTTDNHKSSHIILASNQNAEEPQTSLDSDLSSVQNVEESQNSIPSNHNSVQKVSERENMFLSGLKFIQKMEEQQTMRQSSQSSAQKKAETPNLLHISQISAQNTAESPNLPHSSHGSVEEYERENMFLSNCSLVLKSESDQKRNPNSVQSGSRAESSPLEPCGSAEVTLTEYFVVEENEDEPEPPRRKRGRPFKRERPQVQTEKMSTRRQKSNTADQALNKTVDSSDAVVAVKKRRLVSPSSSGSGNVAIVVKQQPFVNEQWSENIKKKSHLVSAAPSSLYKRPFLLNPEATEMAAQLREELVPQMHKNKRWSWERQTEEDGLVVMPRSAPAFHKRLSVEGLCKTQSRGRPRKYQPDQELMTPLTSVTLSSNVVTLPADEGSIQQHCVL